MQFGELQVVNRVRSLATNDEPQAQGFLVSFPFQNILAWSVVPQVEAFFFVLPFVCRKTKRAIFAIIQIYDTFQ